MFFLRKHDSGEYPIDNKCKKEQVKEKVFDYFVDSYNKEKSPYWKNNI